MRKAPPLPVIPTEDDEEDGNDDIYDDTMGAMYVYFLTLVLVNLL
jgi:hypothetical protein